MFTAYSGTCGRRPWRTRRACWGWRWWPWTSSPWRRAAWWSRAAWRHTPWRRRPRPRRTEARSRPRSTPTWWGSWRSSTSCGWSSWSCACPACLTCPVWWPSPAFPCRGGAYQRAGGWRWACRGCRPPWFYCLEARCPGRRRPAGRRSRRPGRHSGRWRKIRSKLQNMYYVRNENMLKLILLVYLKIIQMIFTLCLKFLTKGAIYKYPKINFCHKCLFVFQIHL